MAEYSDERFNSSANNRQRASLITESLDPARPTNVVYKTTSESLRLTIEPQTGQVKSPSSNNLEPNKQKKSSSFQITSVTVSSSVSNDGEDDSCGETEPSEAGGSRNFNDLEVEMFEESDSINVTSNIDSVPVSTTHHNFTQQVNHSEAGAIVGGLKLEDKDQQALQQRRFRVVKIESSEPFKRGRWLCMDYLDHPSVQQSISTREEPASSHSSSGSLTENLHVEDLTISNVTVQPNNIPLQAASSSAVLNPNSQPQLQQQQQQPPSQSSIHQVAHSLPASAASINYPTVSPAVQQHQPLYQQQQSQSSMPVYPVASVASMAAVVSNPTSLAMPIIVSQSAGPALPAAVGAIPSQTYVQHSVPAGLLHGNQQPPVAATVVPVQPIFTAPTNVQPQQQYVPTSLQAIQTTMAGTPQQSQSQLAPTTVSVTQVPVLAQQQTGLIQQSSLNTVAATAGVSSGLPLSSTIHPVVVMQPATTMTAPLASVGQPPSSSSSQAGVGLQQPTLVAQHSSIPPIQQQQQPPPSQTSVPGSMTVLQGPPVAFDVNQQQSLTQPNHLIHQQAAPPMTLGVASQPIASNSEPVQQPIQPQQQTQQQQQVHHIQQPVIQQQQQSAVTTVQPHIPQQTVVPPPVLVQQQQTQSSSVPIVLPVYTSAQIPSVQPIASSVVVSSTTTTVTATSALGATGVLGAVGPVVEKDGQEIHAGEEASAAGGSSTVAIDNKIEQAMDLVKSHLMFAVREEVEVLKERIAELEERIAFLESENAILRSTATQDALAQIAHLETTFNSTGAIADGGNTIVASASAAGPAVMPGSSINISVASTATNAVPNGNSTQSTNGAPPTAP